MSTQDVTVEDERQTLISDVNSPPFEGPEKLLEIWFEPPADSTDRVGKIGLRSVAREKWEAMLEIVRCKVLSVIEGQELDAYLLSESSLFIYPYKLILKTCGTTLNLLGLPRILEIALLECNLSSVIRCFYSRKSFMFPERQVGPHRDWKEEVRFLDDLFSGGAAYTVGKMNGDHWLLWLVDQTTAPSPNSSASGHSLDPDDLDSPVDYTIEILMSNLSVNSRQHFFFSEDEEPSTPQVNGYHTVPSTPHSRALELSHRLGISSIFPPGITQLDAYAFDPCGYSANAVITPGNGIHTEGYWTIHVTPEEGWSYASFECNVPSSSEDNKTSLPSLLQLIQRVVDIFQPGNISVTLFVSNGLSVEESPIETAQAVFRKALLPKGYKRTDKITYEFSGYDLAFASFTL